MTSQSGRGGRYVLRKPSNHEKLGVQSSLWQRATAPNINYTPNLSGEKHYLFIYLYSLPSRPKIYGYAFIEEEVTVHSLLCIDKCVDSFGPCPQMGLQKKVTQNSTLNQTKDWTRDLLVISQRFYQLCQPRTDLPYHTIPYHINLSWSKLIYIVQLTHQKQLFSKLVFHCLLIILFQTPKNNFLYLSSDEVTEINTILDNTKQVYIIKL